MESNKTVLVTGGGGFLGNAIVRMLVDRGDRVCSFSRQRYPELDRLGVFQHTGDLGDADAVRRACRGVAAVFHVAAKPGVWGPYEAYYQANVQGTLNVIAACRAEGVRRLIYTSSPSAVFDGRDMEGVDESVPYPARYEAHYPRTKALAEQAVLDAARNGLPAIVLRPHLIWGPGDNHLAPRLLARAAKLRRVGTGDNKVDTIYVDNAARAHVLAERRLAESPELSGRIYFISQDDPIPLWEMVDHILAAGGLPPVRKKISPALARFAGTLCEALFHLFRIKSEPPMTRFVANELATAHWFDISAAKRDLGYRVEVSTEQGLRRLAEWLKTHQTQAEVQIVPIQK
ncbi:NAD-dependent epimerase/dehydratase family protein [Desulfatitalea tepidiphila]|uniref:NAD-dependent epimerase/dehydratase family protein n=1 Tax=Desulfatitalea tepidiphila TaxID=1185843 RepID=UPI00128ED8E3|nr:NAD-dependent epimerase/dehydratase family protein [Desulfatitalea tepidiphila]